MRKLLLAVLAALVLCATPAAASSGGPGTGWVRLAHLSPGTPVVDVYLYAFGDPHAHTVLHNVGLGDISGYLALPAGEYTVAIRKASTNTPLISTAVWVDSGMMYTIVGIGEGKRTRLEVLDDTFTASPSLAMVRVLSASVSQRQVSVRVGNVAAGRNLGFGQLSAYRTVAKGTDQILVSCSSLRQAESLSLGADSVHTLVVLDDGSGVRVIDLVDAVGVAAVPDGGAATGLGGTASGTSQSPLPWVVMILAGVGLTTVGLRRRLAR